MKKTLYLVLGSIIVVYLCSFVVRNSYDIVPPGMTGARVTLGTVSDEAVKGFVWKVPFISNVIKMNTRQQTYVYHSENVKANNIQKVSLNCSIIYQVTENNVPKMIQNVDCDNYLETILMPRISSALQETIGKNDVFLLVTKPEMIREATQYILADQLKTDDYLQIKEVLFDTPKFSDEFEDAINKKLTEQQLLEFAQIQTKKVEEEAKQALLLASVEPQVLSLLNKAMTNPLIIKYEAMKALQKWDGKLNLPSTLMMSGESGNVLPVLPIKSK